MKVSFSIIFAIYFASLVGNSISNLVLSPFAGPQVAHYQVVDHQVADHHFADPQVAVQQVQTTQFVDPYAAGSFPTWDWTVLSDGPF